MKKSIFIPILFILFVLSAGALYLHGKVFLQQQENNEPQQRGDLVWYQVPELGIEFQVTSQAADELIYAVSESNSNDLSGGAAFSSKELAKIPGCEASFGPLGTLTKLKGIPDDYKENEYLMARNPKQFDGFFVVWSGPQAVCAAEEHLDEFDSYFQNNHIFDRWSDIVFNTIRNIR